MTQPLTPAQFDASLARGSAVEAHWTSTGHRYVAPATVIKVNLKSVLVRLELVRLDADVYAGLYGQTQDGEGRCIYPANHVISLPRYASASYSQNNGAYPVVGEAEVDMLPVIDDEARQALPADHATIQEMIGDAAAQQPEEYPGETDDLRDFPPFQINTDPETQTDLDVLAVLAERVALVLDLADARGTLDDEDEPLRFAAPLVWLYTTAPRDLDLAGTVAVEDMGMLHRAQAWDESPLPYRKVQLPAGQELAQASAYGSGGWNVHTPAEWAGLLGQAWFQARFVPRGCEVSVDDGQGKLSPALEALYGAWAVLL